MKQGEFGRLKKIEERIYEIVTEEMGLKCKPVEFDIVPTTKMLEIMAYRCPTQISNWKFGRDFERLRTILDNYDPSLPYEVVINDNPSRAYLMNSNTLAIQALVIAHVYGHVNFYTENQWFKRSRSDIIELLAESNRRFNEYERVYGKDEVERVIDAGHALQWHSKPEGEETEEERRLRIFEQTKLKNKPDTSEFRDIVKVQKSGANVEAYNMHLWRELKAKTPVEPQADILRYIIDNSRKLDRWEKDILETLRSEGLFYYPNMKTRYMNEGWAVFIHQKVMKQLFEEGLLNEEEHGQFNYSNSLVKASNPFGMNPYLVGSVMWEDIEERWNKGKYGPEWDECENSKDREEWDTGEMKGMEKALSVMKTYSDWFFMQEFLTLDLVDKLELYLYLREILPNIEIDVITGHGDEEIKDIIIKSFANSGVPLIEIVDGNYANRGILLFEHRWNDLILEPEYAKNTMSHIQYLWGNYAMLKTKYYKSGKLLTTVIRDPNMPEEILKKLLEDLEEQKK